MKIKRLLNDINILRTASRAKKLAVSLKMSNWTMSFIKYFYNKGLVAGYRYEGIYIKIYLKYRNNIGVLDRIVFARNLTHKKKYAKYKNLVRQYYSTGCNYVDFYLTNSGIKELEDIVVQHSNIGGLFLFSIKYS